MRTVSTKTIEIAIIVEDPKTKEQLINATDEQKGFRLVSIYKNLDQAWKQLKYQKPDVILVGLFLEPIKSIEFIFDARKRYQNIKFLVLSPNVEQNLVFDALRAGASGYLDNNISWKKLTNAIHDVMTGGAPMSPYVSKLVVDSFRSDSKISVLTGREKDVLKELCDGCNYALIAENLFITLDTVRFHIKNIYRKLGVKSKSQAVSKAMRYHIVG